MPAPLQPPSRGQPHPLLLGLTHQRWAPTSSCVRRFHALCCPGFLFLCLLCNAEPGWSLLFPPTFIFSSCPHRHPMGWDLQVSPAVPHQIPGLVQHRAATSNSDTARSIPMLLHWARPSLPLQAEHPRAWQSFQLCLRATASLHAFRSRGSSKYSRLHLGSGGWLLSGVQDTPGTNIRLT